MKFYKNIFILLFSLPLLISISGCYKMPKKASMAMEDEKTIQLKRKLDFTAENTTQNTLYVTCFYYTKAPYATRWSWEKSPVYQLIPKEQTIINITAIPSEDNYPDVYGYLGIFKNIEDADDAIFETTSENEKIDIGQLYNLKGKKISINDKAYGTSRFYDFLLNPIKGKEYPKLDFTLTNSTGENIYVALFTYEDRASDLMWEWYKSEVSFIENGKSAKINIDTSLTPGTFDAAYSYIGIFKENQRQFADTAIYGSLNSTNKIHLGYIKKLANKNVIIYKKEYGILRYAYGILTETTNIPPAFAYKVAEDEIK